MCIFGGGAIPHDNSAEIARQQEAERQARISQGETRIADAFKPFDDNYYSGVSKDYLGYYEPQLQDQYTDARKHLTYDLGRTGVLNTSAGAERLADLFKEYGKNRTQIADRAAGAANEARSKVEASRSDLLSQNRGSADPSSISALAASQAGILSAPGTYNPLGDIFANFLNQGTTAALLQTKGYPGWGLPLPSASPVGGGSSSSGSARVIQ